VSQIRLGYTMFTGASLVGSVRSLATRPVLGIHSLPCVSLASPCRDDKDSAVKHLTAVYPPFSHVVQRRLALVAHYLCPGYLPDVCEACHGKHRRNVSISSAFYWYLSQRFSPLHPVHRTRGRG